MKPTLISLSILLLCTQFTTEFKLKTPKSSEGQASETQSTSPPEKESESESQSKPNEAIETSSQPKPKSKTQGVLNKKEIEEESKTLVGGCVAADSQEGYIECVIDNLSLKFFFTAFTYYKRRFKKKYNSVNEEMKRFTIFIHNYKIILRWVYY